VLSFWKGFLYVLAFCNYGVKRCFCLAHLSFFLVPPLLTFSCSKTGGATYKSAFQLYDTAPCINLRHMPFMSLADSFPSRICLSPFDPSCTNVPPPTCFLFSNPSPSHFCCVASSLLSPLSTDQTSRHKTLAPMRGRSRCRTCQFPIPPLRRERNCTCPPPVCQCSCFGFRCEAGFLRDLAFLPHLVPTQVVEKIFFGPLLSALRIRLS